MTDTAKLKAAAEKAKDDFLPNMTISTRDVLELIAALEAAQKRNAELTDALKQAVSGYKSCLRTGHERIVELGGECDAPETMIAGNPDIRLAEKVLAAGINLETGGE